jgi:hypothetical protein
LSDFEIRQRASTPLGEVRCRQIKLGGDIDGDQAQGVARKRPDGVHTALLVEITNEWRIAES